MDDLQSLITKVAPEIIAMFGSINPVLGAVVATLIALLLGYIGCRAAKEKRVANIESTGGTVADQTGKDQSVSSSVQDKMDDFLDKD